MRKWEGMTIEQWIEVWDSTAWRDDVEDVLRDVIECRDSRLKDRAAAMSLLQAGMIFGVFEGDPTFPHDMRDAMMRDLRRSAKHKKNRKKKRRMRRQLKSCQRIMNVVLPWFQSKHAADARAEQARAEQIPTNN